MFQVLKTLNYFRSFIVIIALIFTLFAISLGLTLGLIFTYKIIRDINKLKDFMVEVEKSNLNLNVILERNDEIGELATGFTKMALRIKEIIKQRYFTCY